jgi:ABC-type nickel/cobalt efflux system permease component RcnA
LVKNTSVCRIRSANQRCADTAVYRAGAGAVLASRPFIHEDSAMRQHISRLLVPALAIAALAVVLPSQLRAQDRPEDGHEQHDQAPAGHGDQQPASHMDTHDEERADPHPDAHRNVGRPDPVVQYRHDHPHASARCHDGFFTTTSDRGRACSKHGGIDVWLAL